MSDTQVEFTPIEWSTSPDYTGYTLVHAGGQVSLELLSRPDTIKIQVFRLHPASGEGEHRLLLRVRGAAAIITQEHTNGKGFLVQEGESFRMVETPSAGDSPLVYINVQAHQDSGWWSIFVCDPDHRFRLQYYAGIRLQFRPEQGNGEVDFSYGDLLSCAKLADGVTCVIGHEAFNAPPPQTTEG